MFHGYRIGPDEELTEIIDAHQHTSRLPFESALPPAHQTFIGFQLHEHVGAVGRRSGNRDAKRL